MNHNAEEQYKVTETFNASGKCILIVGAGGNWGGHFSLGMPAACGCDAVLVDLELYCAELEEVARDIKTAGLPVKTEVCYLQKEDLLDRIALYRKLEASYGSFASILDVEGIDTVRSFPGSAAIEQKPVVEKEDMKPRYQVGPNDVLPGKTVLIIGAGGNWGGHMAAGMGLAGQASLVLVDIEERKPAIDGLLAMLGDAVKAEVCYVSKAQLSDRYALLADLQVQYGTFDAVMDLTGINAYFS